MDNRNISGSKIFLGAMGVGKSYAACKEIKKEITQNNYSCIAFDWTRGGFEINSYLNNDPFLLNLSGKITSNLFLRMCETFIGKSDKSIHEIFKLDILLGNIDIQLINQIEKATSPSKGNNIIFLIEEISAINQNDCDRLNNLIENFKETNFNIYLTSQYLPTGLLKSIPHITPYVFRGGTNSLLQVQATTIEPKSSLLTAQDRGVCYSLNEKITYTK